MGRESRDHHEDDEPSLPPRGEHRPSRAECTPKVTIEFGELELTAPEGGRWDEWVITRGLAEAEQERRPIDHRTAYYIATFLSKPSTPALRNLAATGTIHMNGLRGEVVGLTPEQTQLVQTWIDWLAHYCLTRDSREPVEDWQPAIRQQDRVETEWLRREQIFASLDELFQMVPAHQRVPNAGQPGWYGLVRREDHAGGGVIIFEGGAGERRVWASDSDEELDRRYTAIVEAQRQWIVDTLGEATRASEYGDADEQRGTPDEPPPSSSAG
jgi:hypothetical protein